MLLDIQYILKTAFNLYNIYNLLMYTKDVIKLNKKKDLNRCLISWIINSTFIIIEYDQYLSNHLFENYYLSKLIITILVNFGEFIFVFFYCIICIKACIK